MLRTRSIILTHWTSAPDRASLPCGRPELRATRTVGYEQQSGTTLRVVGAALLDIGPASRHSKTSSTRSRYRVSWPADHSLRCTGAGTRIAPGCAPSDRTVHSAKTPRTVVDRPIVSPQPPTLLVDPALDHLSRKRIDGAKRDEYRHAGLKPMR